MATPSVIGKYQVTRQLAQGGMGTLYLARDPGLGRDVVIKVIRGDFDDEARRARFAQEAQSVSRLRHPNIVTIYEFGEFDGEPFLAMERIVGESLGACVSRGEPLPIARKLEILDQVCAAMAYAHRAHVIHRDLKPDNIMIDAETGLVKIVDFGIARQMQGDESRFTQGIGTPNYTAPEQFMGQADHRSDIYAIGAVAYELIAYRHAFDGDTPFAVMGKIVLDNPPALTDVCPDLDPAIAAIVATALEKEPANRYQDLDAMRDDIRRAAGLSAVREPAVPRSRRIVRRRALGVAAVLVAAIGAFAVTRVRPHPPVPVARRSVAVLGFKNLSGRAETAWMSTALSEMLTSELSAGERLRALSGEDVARMKIDLRLVDVDGFAGDTLARIRQHSGADVVIVGSYLPAGDAGRERIRLDLRLQDAAAGETVAVISDTAPETELLDLVARTGARVRAQLGVGALSRGESANVLAAAPSTPEAQRLYAEGLQRLRVFDNHVARDLLDQARIADPQAPMISAALAAAWAALGYDRESAAAAQRAFEQSTGLSREGRLSVEGRFHESRREWHDAIRVYRSLVDFFPDNVEYGLRLAAAQEAATQGQAALATLDAIRLSASGDAADPRIDLAESSVARSISDTRRSLAAAERAQATADARGVRLVTAQARFQQGVALADLGELQKSQAALEAAKAIFDAAGDRAAAARTGNVLAQVVARRGDPEGARAALTDALETYRQIGNVSGVALIEANLGNIDSLGGDVDKAMAHWERALAMYRELRDKDGIARTQNNIGTALFKRGNPAAAATRFEEALALWREIGRVRNTSSALVNLTFIRRDLGDLAGARRLCEEALTVDEQVGDQAQFASDATSLASILYSQDDLPGARRRAEQAIASADRIGAKRAGALARMNLAVTLVEFRQLTDARALVQTALHEFRKQKSSDSELEGLVSLALVELTDGRIVQAQEAVTAGERLASGAQNRRAMLDWSIIAGQVLTALQQFEAAESRLRAAIAQARQMQMAGYELDANLALGSAMIASGRIDVGRKQLEATFRRASASGFMLIARKAKMAR